MRAECAKCIFFLKCACGFELGVRERQDFFFFFVVVKITDVRYFTFSLVSAIEHTGVRACVLVRATTHP